MLKTFEFRLDLMQIHSLLHELAEQFIVLWAQLVGIYSWNYLPGSTLLLGRTRRRFIFIFGRSSPLRLLLHPQNYTIYTRLTQSLMIATTLARTACKLHKSITIPLYVFTTKAMVPK